jgi:hypothetical protein
LGARLPGSGPSSLNASPLSASAVSWLRSCNFYNTENDRVRRAVLEGEMMMADDAPPVELWQRHAEESPHTSDEEIERLFIAAAKDNEDRIRRIMEWGFR